MITRKKTVMERGAKPTFECLSNEDHDEDLLHTPSLAQHKAETILVFSIKKDELVINTTED